MRYQAITPILFAHYVASATIRPGLKPARGLESVRGLALSPRQFDEVSPGPLSPGMSDPGLSFPGSSGSGPPFSGPSDSGSLFPGSSGSSPSFSGPSDSGPSFSGPSDSGSLFPGSSGSGPSFSGPSDSGSFLPGSSGSGPSFPGSLFPDQPPSAPTLPDQQPANQPSFFQPTPNEQPANQPSFFEPIPKEQPAKQPSPFEPIPNEQPAKQPSPFEPIPSEKPSKQPSPFEPIPIEQPAKKPSPIEPVPIEQPAKKPSPIEPVPIEQPAKQPSPFKPIPSEQPSKKPSPDETPQKQPFPVQPRPDQQPPVKPSPQPSFQPSPESTLFPGPSVLPKPEPESELSLRPIQTPVPKPKPEPTPSPEPVLTLTPTLLPAPQPESTTSSTTTKSLNPELIPSLLPLKTITLKPKPTPKSESTTTSTTSSTTTSTTSSTTKSISRPTQKPVTQPAFQAIVVDILHTQNVELGIPFRPMMTMQFGTPPQEITGVLDTGSSDVIIPMAGSAVCKLQKQQCRGSNDALGDYDPAADSDVNKVISSGFQAEFLNGDTYNGPYISTTVRVGDGTIKAAQVGLAVNGSVSEKSTQLPIFGMGPMDGEQTVDPRKYPNIPQTLKDTGAANANVFGVWLNPKPLAKGSLVLGGMDSTKFTGQLQSVPIEPDNNGKFSNFVVRLNSVQLSMKGTSGGQQRNRRLQSRQAVTMDLGLGQNKGYTSVDTGTPFIVLPPSTMENLARALGTTFSEEEGLGRVDCALASKDNSLVLGFNQGQTMVRVPLDRTVISNDVLAKTSPQADGCALAIGSAGQDDALNTMGYPFMSAVYTVFDMDMRRLLFAQAV